MSSGKTRRESLKQFAAATGVGVGTTAMASAPSAAAKRELDLSDPIKALETRVKMMGSLNNETVTSFMRLNVYGDPHDGNFVPLFTMNNLVVDTWERVAEDTFELTKYEAGFYTKFDSHETIDTFDNPWTGETIDIFNFRLGPVNREYTPNEIIAMAFAPEPLPLEVIGDRVFLATQSMAETQTMFPRERFPIEGSHSNTEYLNSFMTYSASYDDIVNPDIASAPVHMQIQNKLGWAPWMRMRGREGGSSLRGFGTKIASIDELPQYVIDGFAERVPEILDTPNWEEPVFETFDYLRYLEEKKAKG